MAEIEIERKRGGSPWPWILGLAVLLLVVWGIWQMMDRDDEGVVATDPYEQQTPAAPAAVPAADGSAPTTGAQFQAWLADSAQALEQMGRQHEYTREGIRRMTAALSGLVARDSAPQVQQKLQSLQQQAQAIQQSDASSSEHANQASQAFMTAVDVLSELRSRPHLQGAGLDQPVSAARSAAERVSGSTPLLEQRQQVQDFFRQMAQAIQVAEGHRGA